jgi:hypothetical protein
MVGGLASSARPEKLHKISKIRVLLKNYARDATPHYHQNQSPLRTISMANAI